MPGLVFGEQVSYPFYTALDRPTPTLELLEGVIGARFILFRVRGAHRDLLGYRDYASKVETTFWMGLKGGIHLFAGATRGVTIRSFHFDGHQHYRRKIDAQRIIRGLGNLRDDVHVPSDTPIDDRTSDHSKPNSQLYDDCQLLQLADLLVGGFRTVLGYQANDAQGALASPLCELAKRWHQGPARMRNSRWNKGFCISECYLENGAWAFGDIRLKVADKQLPLLDV